MSKKKSTSTQHWSRQPASSRTESPASVGLHVAGPSRLAIPDIAHSFDDSAGYERFIGRWGRAAGAIFLDWLAPPSGARWLDVGCGTGLFTELVVATRDPAAVCASGQAPGQIQNARSKVVAQRTDFPV